MKHGYDKLRNHYNKDLIIDNALELRRLCTYPSKREETEAEWK